MHRNRMFSDGLSARKMIMKKGLRHILINKLSQNRHQRAAARFKSGGRCSNVAA